ncbi:MAG: aminotransferase class I/II-fold pyridoxal phosphate-dependent enzyme [Treponemataceae bacterium]
MQAVILAAGMGKRLKDLTADNTKCMVKVNGVTLIERMLYQLDNLGLSKIIIVIGYEAKKLTEYVNTLSVKTTIIFVTNEIYDRTNNIYSLYLACNYLLEEDTLLLESDLIFEDSALQKIVSCSDDSAVLVAKYESWMDGTVITADEDNNITGFLDKTSFSFQDTNDYYKTVNIYKFSKNFSQTRYVPFLEAYSKAMGNNEYYEQVLKVITILNNPEIKALPLEGELWYEIDDIQDLDIAEILFQEDMDKKLKKMQSRYGGYWRFPQLIDFCYLVNPFFPPQKMLDELKSKFDILIHEYPSGLSVNNLLAAKNLGIKQDYIVVGNGAAELIKSIMEKIEGCIGIAMPTFQEYPNRKSADQVIPFYPQNKNFSYTADDLINFYDNKNILLLTLINPDNPSGNYLSKSDVLKLAEWTSKKNIFFIVDESFIDFSNAECTQSSLSVTFIDNDILESFKNLIVIKSISKSFGVPGLRLGVLASSNAKIIDCVKKDISIWNINSVAEYYLQIYEKYRGEYEKGQKKFMSVRDDFYQKLAAIKNIRVIPSQANYFLCELECSISAIELAKLLLSNYNILIKDLSDKDGMNGEFVRIAVKSLYENDKLIHALQEIL